MHSADVEYLSDVQSAKDANFYEPDRDEDDSGPAPDGGDEKVCNSTKPLLGILHTLCYDNSRPCEGYRVRARLFLDIGGSPFHISKLDGVTIDYGNGHGFGLLAQCRIEGVSPAMTQIGFSHDYDEAIDPASLPGLRNQLDWKVEIADAAIEYCESCYTMEGQLPEFGFSGSLEDVQFVKDVKDELPPFIEVKDADGNLVSDIR
jgi:hypothetical protein